MSSWKTPGGWVVESDGTSPGLVSSTLLLGILDTDFNTILSEEGWSGAPTGELPFAA